MHPLANDERGTQVNLVGVLLTVAAGPAILGTGVISVGAMASHSGRASRWALTAVLSVATWAYFAVAIFLGGGALFVWAVIAGVTAVTDVRSSDAKYTGWTVAIYASPPACVLLVAFSLPI